MISAVASVILTDEQLSDLVSSSWPASGVDDDDDLPPES